MKEQTENKQFQETTTEQQNNGDLDKLLSKPLGNAFDNIGEFEKYQRMARLLSTSSFIPKAYKGNIGDCVVALNLANRLRVDVLAVMQNLYVVHGMPAWSSKFMIAQLNACGRWGKLQFKFDLPEKEESFSADIYWRDDNGKSQKKTVTAKLPNWSCRAIAIEKETGEVMQSIKIDMKMAIAEGWFHKPGSKWQTMPELMLQYRAASFFVNMHEPNLLMGIRSFDEIQDMEDLPLTSNRATKPATKGTAGLKQALAPNAEKITEEVNAALDPFLTEMETAEKDANFYNDKENQ